MATPSNLSEQILALPSGAGSVQSAGQTFEVRPYTGTGSYVIPIETKSGHAGITPALSLTYSTHAGSDIAGLGWSLGLARIERRTDKGLPTFDDQVDTFALQGDELLPVGGGYYRLRIESRFARIRHVRENGRNFWVVTERDGTRVFYGLEPDDCLHDDAGKVGAWYPSKKQDANGNEVVFSYVRSASTRDTRLTSVEWAGCYRVSLTYEERPDFIQSFRPGFEHLRRHRLIQVNIEVRMQSSQAYHTYRIYALSYVQSPLTGRSLLAAVGVTGVSADGSRHELPVLKLGYNQPELAQMTWHSLSGALPGGSLQDRNLTLVRQSGSGLPDVLETTTGGHWLRENLGNGRFRSAKRVASPAQVLLETAGTFISDMNGDGWGDLVVNGGDWVYRGIAGGGWGLPYSSSEAPAVDLEAPNVRVADFNADGLPDALRLGAKSWVYFQNLGEGRWAPGVSVLNAPPVRLDDSRVHLTDINGDGIPDLVYMERSRVRVWPGEGLGQFGQAYELTNPPGFGPSFDPKDVRWADLTGSGQADLLYIQNGLVEIFFNQAGLGLSDSVTLTTLRQSSRGHVEPVDLFGTDAEGLLLTDYQERPDAWRYLELFPGGKPDLLIAIENGLGATTTIEYGSSAACCVADKLAGKPWRTALPLPQVVVASVTVHDAVTDNRLGVTYQYHHGVYDGEEREFRGFALVEQIDREADPDDPLPLAPVLVKRWYHTGVDVDLRDQYTALPEGALADEVPALPWALRSLRGQLKREETFALDGDPKPYLVQETAYRVFPIEHAPRTQRYCFAPLPVKSRMTHLERSEERRIVETVTTYDRHRGKGYGLPIEVREKAYGRRGVFSTAHEIAQTADLECVTITEYVNRSGPDGDYLGPYTPSYLVGKPARVEHNGLSGSSEVLLARVLYFYDGEAYKGLGYPGTETAPGVTIGRLSCELVLAFTDDLLAKAYPTNTGAHAAFDASGHYLSDGAQQYVHAQRYRYDARGMLTGSLDPNGNEALIEYDAVYGLFPVLYTDALRHPTGLTRGSLPFQVAGTLDANGNTVSFTYDPVGLLATKSVQGKFVAGEWIGDPPAFPTELYVYDFTTTPCKVLLETRQQRLGATFRVVRYVDGLGRTIQERHEAEPDPTTGSSRVRVTGWQVFNHKGLVVKVYQPVFADSDAYEEGDTTTAFVAMIYDPLGRPVRIDYPDGTFETTTFHPWVQVFFDRNDNAGHITNSDPRYGRFRNKFKGHAGTPKRTYVDALGRMIAEAQDNGSELHVTRKVLDLKNQITEVWDARALTQATWTFVYDFMGRSVHTRNSTALGDRYALGDAAGNPIWERDARGSEVIRAFDALNRPLSEMTRAGAALNLRRQWRYTDYDENAPEFASNQSKNLFRQVEEERDADGLRYFEYDWRGLVTQTSHRLWSQTDSAGRAWHNPNSELWSLGADWDPEIAATDRESIASYLELPQLTDPVTFAIVTKHDAAGRPHRCDLS
jgi:Insecticide toxin TcdB middle/N-terminal region/Salmonella virulence plasmid 65kDa B protein/FG-GAP-like repeat/Insecticide toxin TcdB middle/C-terminal region